MGNFLPIYDLLVASKAPFDSSSQTENTMKNDSSKFYRVADGSMVKFFYRLAKVYEDNRRNRSKCINLVVFQTFFQGALELPRGWRALKEDKERISKQAML